MKKGKAWKEMEYKWNYFFCSSVFPLNNSWRIVGVKNQDLETYIRLPVSIAKLVDSFYLQSLKTDKIKN